MLPLPFRCSDPCGAGPAGPARALGAFLLIGLLLAPPASAQPSPSGRRSTDRSADLIEAMLEVGLIASAERIALQRLETLAAGTDESARWEIRLAMARTAAALDAEADDADRWRAASEGLEQSLESYPDQPRAPWLRLQRALVDLAQARRQLLRYHAAPENPAPRDAALRRLAEVLERLRTLDRALAELIPRAESGQAAEGAATAADLVNLRHSVGRRMLETLLLRSEAYPPESADALAAATEAQRQARQLLSALPDAAPARQQSVRLLAEAQLRSGEADEARRTLEGWADRAAAGLDPAAQALLVRIHLATGRRAEAAEILEQHFGTDPAAAPHSVELDLARLQWMLAEVAARRGAPPGEEAPAEDEVPEDEEAPVEDEAPGERDEVEREGAPVTLARVSAWIDRIGQRHGAYARRQAEVMVLGTVRLDPVTADPTLLAAQAASLLRGGDVAQAGRAAELLLAAANAAREQGDATAALRLAMQGGAALKRFGDPEAAAQVIAQAALAAPEEPLAPAAHLEAARIVTEQLRRGAAGDPVEGEAAAVSPVERLEEMLAIHLEQWPAAEASDEAQRWLVAVYASTGRFGQAAEAALARWPLQPASDVQAAATREAIAQAGTLLRRGLEAAGDDEGSPAADQAAEAQRRRLIEQAAELLGPWAQAPEVPAALREAAAVQWVLTAAVGADRESLRRFALLADRLDAAAARGGAGARHMSDSEQAQALFALALYRLRHDGVEPSGSAAATLQPLDAEQAQRLRRLAIARLREDGRAAPSPRALATPARLGAALLQWLQLESATEGEEAIAAAEALAWTGRWQEARQRLEQLAAGPPRTAEPLRRAARLLGEVDDPEGVREAITLWSRLAGGVPRGSPAWHEARLSAARLHRQLGEADRARQLASYILMTQPPDDPALRQQYEALAAP